MVSVAWKLCTTEQCIEQSCFGEELTGTMVTNLKNSWVRVLMNMGFGMMIIFSMILNDTYRMIRPMEAFEQ
jgi:hypothetical protein